MAVRRICLRKRVLKYRWAASNKDLHWALRVRFSHMLGVCSAVRRSCTISLLMIKVSLARFFQKNFCWILVNEGNLFTASKIHTSLISPNNSARHKRFYTENPLHTDAFTYRCLYTQAPLHTDAFTHRRFYTQAPILTDTLTHRRFYTQTFLHTGSFTHRLVSTQTLLHTDAFTHTQMSLHTDPFTHRCFLQFYPSFWHSNLISCERVAAGPAKLAKNHQFFWHSNLISCERVANSQKNHQFLTIEPHFEWNSCRGSAQSAILPQFLTIEPHFVLKGCCRGC